MVEMGNDIEGLDRQELMMRYLRRDSSVKIGDLVVTSGLGGSFAAGIPIGWGCRKTAIGPVAMFRYLPRVKVR